MSPEAETAERPRDTGAEPELDLGRFWKAILLRWWVILIGVVAGAIIGLLVSLGGGKQYKATAEIYLGQPLSPGGSAQISSTSTSLGLANYLVSSESALRTVEHKVGLSRGRLRGKVSSKPILGLTGTKLGTAAPILAITVSGASRSTSAAAANALGSLVIKQFATYPGSKLQTLQAQADRDTKQLEGVNSRLAAAIAAQQDLLSQKGIGSTDKLVALANFNLVISSATTQQTSLQNDQSNVLQQIAAVKNVESPRVVSPASGVHAAGPSRRSGAIVGAIIGFVLGILAAVLWEPLVTRVRQAT